MRKMVEVMGTPGIIRDIPAHKLPDGAFSEGLNVRFGEEGAESLAEDLGTFSVASITPLWLQYFPPVTLPHWVYADLTTVWVYEGTTHTEITRISGDYAAIAEERWQSTVLNGVGVLNNTIDIPQAWTKFEAATPLVNLPNWTSTRRAKSIRAFKNFLVALNMTDSGVNRPYRILWSDSADVGTLPGSWDSTNPTTDSREFDLAETSDYLVDQLVLGDVNIIYKEHSTWGMQYIGPPFFFRFWKILATRGLLHRDCVVSFPFGHIVVTQDDIIVHSGQVEQSISILQKNLRKWLFDTIDPVNFKNCFLLANPRKSEVYFYFPSLGEVYANNAIIWNWENKSIGVRDVVSTPFGAVGPIGESITDDDSWG